MLASGAKNIKSKKHQNEFHIWLIFIILLIIKNIKTNSNTGVAEPRPARGAERDLRRQARGRLQQVGAHLRGHAPGTPLRRATVVGGQERQDDADVHPVRQELRVSDHGQRVPGASARD